MNFNSCSWSLKVWKVAIFSDDLCDGWRKEFVLRVVERIQGTKRLFSLGTKVWWCDVGKKRESNEQTTVVYYQLNHPSAMRHALNATSSWTQICKRKFLSVPQMTFFQNSQKKVSSIEEQERDRCRRVSEVSASKFESTSVDIRASFDLICLSNHSNVVLMHLFHLIMLNLQLLLTQLSCWHVFLIFVKWEFSTNRTRTMFMQKNEANCWMH